MLPGLPLSLPAFWHWDTIGPGATTYNLAESCVLPPRLQDLPTPGQQPDDFARCLGYGDPNGSWALRAAVAALYVGARPEDVLITAGGTEANFLALSALCGPNDRVVIAAPTYQPLHEVPRAQGARVDVWPLRPEDGWRPDLDELRHLLRQPAQLVIINFPNNPTGATVDLEFLHATADLCHQNGALLYADEVFRGLPLGSQIGQPSVWDVAPGTCVLVGSLSKTYGLPGLRVGWLIAPEHVRASARRIRDYTSICSSVLSEAMAVQVLGAGETLLLAQRAHAQRNLEHVAAFLANEDGRLRWQPPREGTIGFVRYSAQLPSRCFARRLAEQWQTLVVPGACFGQEPYFRLGFGGETTALLRGLHRLQAFVAAL